MHVFTEKLFSFCWDFTVIFFVFLGLPDEVAIHIYEFLIFRIGDEDEGDLIKMTKEDALRYLKIVKIAFANKVGKYATFRQLLIDFNNQRIELDTLIFKAKELLQGHKKLIIGFNTFLPKEIKLKVPDDDAVSEDKLRRSSGGMYEHLNV